MTLGEKIAKERKENHYTQEQLAELLGVSRQSVSKWESDITIPETEKLIKMGKLFSCSMDYFFHEEVTEKVGDGAEKSAVSNIYRAVMAQFHERKSEKKLFGMPLYHVGRNAHGFFAVGLQAKGVFSVGLFSRGIVSLGLFSLGVLSLGVLSLGLWAFGVFAFGILTLGAVAVGLFATGAVAVGILSVGALSVGSFSVGALALGKYIALGDHARAMIAVGKSEAVGSVASYFRDALSSSDVEKIGIWLDGNVPQWLLFAKEIFMWILRSV